MGHVQKTSKIWIVLTVCLILSCGFINENSTSNLSSRPRTSLVTPVQLVQTPLGQTYAWAGPLTRSISFVTAPTPGNMVWLSLPVYDAVATAVVDNQGNTYQQAFLYTVICGGNNLNIYGYYALNVQSSGVFTISVTATGPVSSMSLREYSGVATVGTPAGNGAVASLNLSAGPVTVSQTNELLIATQTHCSTRTTSVSAGWGNYEITTEDNGSFQALSTADRINPTPGSYSGTFSLDV